MARGSKGGGSSNPMHDHHKKARQKELQKARERRIRERDEKAVETKTLREVREDIQKAERDLKRSQQGRQKSAAEHRLARLRKELRLLQEATAEAKARADAEREAEKIANRFAPSKRPPTELDDPRKSVYYDSVLNPYGAPPPGKPRLYHRRFGGVTPSVHEAVVPGEEPSLPPPPPPPPPFRHGNQPPPPQRHHPRQGGHNRPPQHHQYERRPQQQQQQKQQQQQRGPPHPNQRPPQQQNEQGSSARQASQKRQPLHEPPAREAPDNKETNKEPPSPAKPPAASEGTKNDGASSPQPSKEPPSEAPPTKPAPPVVPSIPAPSEAVQRTLRVAKRKGRAGGPLADIWASNEEVEYERKTNLLDLEADDVGTKMKKKKKDKKKKKKKPPLEFYYRDNAGAVQGPYSKEQMRGWIDAGYFPPTTKSRTNRMDPDGWVPMGDLPALRETEKNQPPSGGGGGAGADDDDDDDSVQNRIAALKGGASGDGNGDGDADMDESMQARIAAMRADLMAAPAANPCETPGGGPGNEQVRDRIASPRAGTNHCGGGEAGVDPCTNDSAAERIAALRNHGPSVRDRISALGKDAPPPPPPPACPADGSLGASGVGPSPYPVDDGGGARAAAYPFDGSYGAEGCAAYPIDEDGHAGPAPYPVADSDDVGAAGYPVCGDDDDDHWDGAAAYPVGAYGGGDDDEDAVAPYPTDEPYPGGEDLAYPVTDSYPVDDSDAAFHPSPSDAPGALAKPARKVVTVDKALVSFVPTNLQNKKRKTEQDSDGGIAGEDREQNKKTKPDSKSLVAKQSKEDEYDKFMGEIDDL